MRVECEACRALVVASFEIDGNAVRATCPVCRHVMSLPGMPSATLAPPVAAPIAPDATTGTLAPPVAAPIMPGGTLVVATGTLAPASAALLCPKCGAPRRGEATACPACGLAVARMAAYSAARDAADPEVPEAVRTAWARAVADWEAAARHDELLQLVASHHAYAWAAGRYRARGRDAVAERQLERLRRAAEATLLASATARPDAAARPYRATRRVLALLIIMLAAGGLYAMVLADHPMPPAARSIPARPPALGHLPPSTIK